MRTIGTLAALGAVLLAGCAQPGSVAGAPEQPAVNEHLVPNSYDGRFQTVGTVLESPEHGPQFCYYVAESYPPQCGGPDIVGWDWAAVEAESANGTRWGSYEVTGSWDGTTFTLTEPVTATTGSSYPIRAYDFSAPCPEPAGGWPAVPPELADDPAAWEAGHAALHALPELSALWIDQGYTGHAEPDARTSRYVVVLRTTGDVAAMEAAAAAAWSGPVCVVGGGRYTEAEARTIEQELRADPGTLDATVDPVTESVAITVYVATEELQRELDDRYGDGVVELAALFEPLD